MRNQGVFMRSPRGYIGIVAFLAVCFTLALYKGKYLTSNEARRRPSADMFPSLTSNEARRKPLEETIPSPTDNYLNFTSLDMITRSMFVRNRCHELGRLPGFYPNTSLEATVIMDNSHHLIACENLKVGSSTITRLLYKLNNVTEISQHRYRLGVLKHNLPASTINTLPYITAMFVREPLARLLSAYRDNRGVIGKRVSFTKFLTDILDSEHTFDPHHTSFYERCRPCDALYSYVGTMETFDEDLTFILQKMHVFFDIIPVENSRTAKRDYFNKMISEVPPHIKHKIWERYKVDYYLFGYPHP